MKIDIYDKIKLRSGYIGYVVEILGGGAAFVVDVDKEEEIETELIDLEEIETVLAHSG